MVEILKKRTDELSDKEIVRIYDLFEFVFHKRRSVDEFKSQYLNTTLGYSFHALAVDGEKVVGHNVYVPFRYLQGNEPFLLCLSVDAMTHPDYRGQKIYQKLLGACESMAVEAGCRLRVGFPNDNSYPIQVKKFKYNDVGRLDIYCLPIRVGGFNKKLRFLNPFSRLFSGALMQFSRLPGKTEEHIYKYRKDLKDFNSYRYKWFGGDYCRIESGDFTAIYKNSDFKGLPSTFIVDVYPMTELNFDRAVREIYKTEKDRTPFILYVGNLPFSPKSMIRIPASLEPKHFHFVTKILDPEFISGDSLDISNWSLNLSNYDLL